MTSLDERTSPINTPATAPDAELQAEAPAGGGRHVEIFLISLAALLLEISYTRVISFKLFYYYTYLIIGLALLGIGTGAVIVTVSGRLRRASTDSIVLIGLLAGGASVAVGYLVVARTPVSTLAIWDYGTGASVKNLAALVVVCLAIFASFIAVGVMIATILGRGAERIGSLYFADLLGGGIACVVAVSLIDSAGAVGTVFLAGLVLAIGGTWAAWRVRRGMVPVGLALSALLGIVVVQPDVLPDPRVDAFKTQPTNMSHSKWNAVFRIDAGLFGDQMWLFHDGLLGSVISQWDGDVESLGRYNTDARAFPFALDDEAPDQVLIIGAAGGNEVLASLRFGAGHVDAVELNPVTHSLVADRFADFAGNLADRPDVSWLQGDGRSFLTRTDKAYDVIWYPAPDSYSATNAATSGAFVLSESYLYTSEAIVDSLDHLAAGGIIAAQFGEQDFGLKPNRTTRYVSTVRHALAERGIDDPSGHVALVTSPFSGPVFRSSSILVKATPFEPEELDRLGATLASVEGSKVEYLPGYPGDTNPVSEILTLPADQLDAWYDAYPFDMTPVTDDRPFFWHFSRFRTVLGDYTGPTDPRDLEVATGERVLILLLVVAVVFAAAFLLVPFFAVRQIWTTLPAKGRSAAYFAALGLGFMFFEITLIQRLTLFLGYPTYSLTVTLASLLVFTGVGAVFSPRTTRRPQRAVAVLTAAIIALAGFYLVGLPWLTDRLVDVGLPGRVLVTFAVLAPLGLCLGTFMPLGLRTVAALTASPREYVAWGWAVNGFASVIGAVLTTLLAMTFGFRVVLVLGLVVYLVALGVLRGLLRVPALAGAGD